MFLALRELRHAKLRYMLMSFIMVLIVLLVLFVTALARGLSSDNASSIKQMDADYYVLQENSDQRLTRSSIERSTVKQISQALAQDTTVSYASLGVQMTSITKAGSPKKVDSTFFAVDTEQFLTPALVEGKMFGANSADEVIVDRSFTEEGLQIGDLIEDTSTGLQFKIVGFTEGESFSHSPVIHMSFDAWNVLSKNRIIHPAAAGASQAGEDSIPPITAVAVRGEIKDADQLQDQVSGIEVITQAEALKGIPGYKEEQGSLQMMIAFLFIIAAFVLAVFFYVLTIQKIGQFGVLKAIGAKTAYLARTLILQVLLLSVASIGIGIALTYGLSLMLPPSMPFELTPSLVLISSGLFLFVALAGSMLSLYRISKVDAIEAIGRAAA